MRGYIDLVEQYSKLASDETATGVSAVITAADILRPRGSEAATAYFEKLLPDAANPAVARAIRLQLIDLYRQSNQPEKALEQAEMLINSPKSGS